MSVGESYPLFRKPVDIRRWNLSAFGVVTLRIAVPEIIGEDHEDIGLSDWRVGSGKGRQRSEKKDRKGGEWLFH
jgi:hypothetical protein